MAGGVVLGDRDKNILFLVSFSMGHFNSLFLLLRVQIFNHLFFFLWGVIVSFGFLLSRLSVSQEHFGLRKAKCFYDRPELPRHELRTGGNFRVGTGFWEMVGFSFLFLTLFFFHFSLVIEI